MDAIGAWVAAAVGWSVFIVVRRSATRIGPSSLAAALAGGAVFGVLALASFLCVTEERGPAIVIEAAGLAATAVALGAMVVNVALAERRRKAVRP